MHGRICTLLFESGNALAAEIDGETQYKNTYNADETLQQSVDEITGSQTDYDYTTDGTKRLTQVSVSAGTNVNALTETYTYNDYGQTRFNINKHLNSAGGRHSKFISDSVDDIVSMAQKGLKSQNILIKTNKTAKSWQIIVDVGQVVGTKGQTAIRVIVGYGGKIWTMFPVFL